MPKLTSPKSKLVSPADKLAALKLASLTASLQHKISKSLILKEFTALYPPPKSPPPTPPLRPEDILGRRYQRAASLVTSTSLNRVYDVSTEFQAKQHSSLSTALMRLGQMCEVAKRRCDVQFLLNESVKQLATVLRGCDVYVGLLQPGATELQYQRQQGGLADVEGKVVGRSAAEGVSFHCIDTDPVDADLAALANEGEGDSSGGSPTATKKPELHASTTVIAKPYVSPPGPADTPSSPTSTTGRKASLAPPPPPTCPPNCVPTTLQVRAPHKIQERPCENSGEISIPGGEVARRWAGEGVCLFSRVAPPCVWCPLCSHVFVHTCVWCPIVHTCAWCPRCSHVCVAERHLRPPEAHRAQVVPPRRHRPPRSTHFTASRRTHRRQLSRWTVAER